MLKHCKKALCLIAMMANSVYAVNYSEISQLYFFGDSLTDSGFNDLWPTQPGFPAEKAPTFTTYDGHTWAQYVARDIKGVAFPDYHTTPVDTLTNNASIAPVAGFVSATLTNGVNYAAAGSTTNSIGYGEVWAPSLRTQVSFYLNSVGGVADPDAVYFVWSGANDFLQALGGTLPTDLELLTIAQTAAQNVAFDVNRLALAGAKRIVVISLPNLGLTPRAIELGLFDPALPGKIKNLSFQFNSMLNTQLGNVLAQHSNLRMLFIDTYTMLGNVVSKTLSGQPYVIDNQSFYFTNATEPACGTALAVECPSSSANSTYVFADTVHPSDMTHRALSLEVEQAIQNPHF